MQCPFRVSHSRLDKLDQLRDGHDRKLPLFVSCTHKLVYCSLTTALMYCTAWRVQLVDALYVDTTTCRQCSQGCHLIPLEQGLSHLTFVHSLPLLSHDISIFQSQAINFTVFKFHNFSTTYPHNINKCKKVIINSNIHFVI